MRTIRPLRAVGSLSDDADFIKPDINASNQFLFAEISLTATGQTALSGQTGPYDYSSAHFERQPENVWNAV